MRSGIHAASVEKSDRLRRVADVLGRGGWLSTRDLIEQAHVCAVNSCIAELRAQGFKIETKREDRRWFYRLGFVALERFKQEEFAA